MHHKRKRAKNRRSGCLLCKPHKINGAKKVVRVKGLKCPRRLADIDDGQ